jgi:hypothetical protein
MVPAYVSVYVCVEVGVRLFHAESMFAYNKSGMAYQE